MMSVMRGSLILLCQFLACLALAEARMAPLGGRGRVVHAVGWQADATCLDPDALQTASAFTGQEDDETSGAQTGQVESEV